MRAVLLGLVGATLLMAILLACFGKGFADAAAARWLSGLLNAEMRYDSIRVGFASGIEMRGLSINGWPTDGSSLHVGRLRIRPDWRELVGGALRFRAIVIEDWTAVLRPGGAPGPAHSSDEVQAAAVEVLDLALHKGTVFLTHGTGLVRLGVPAVEALVRIGDHESSVRIRKARVSIQDDIQGQIDGSLWRLGAGSWDAQIGIATDAGTFTGTASEAQGGWTWDLIADNADLSRWGRLVAALDDSLGGFARIEASGQALDARGRIDIVQPRWGMWQADEVGTSFQARPDAFVARRFVLRHMEGQVRGSGRLVRQERGWRLDSTVRADSMRVTPPGTMGGMIIVSGELAASGVLAGVPSDLTATMHGGDVSWKSWRLSGIDASVAWADSVLNVDRLIIEEGVIRGRARGRVSPRTLSLHHEFSGSLEPLLAPFLRDPAVGEARVGGVLSGSLDDLGWEGTLEARDSRFNAAHLASGMFAGSGRVRRGQWEASGFAEVRGLRSEGDLIVAAGRARVHASPDGVEVSDAAVVRPGGVVVSGDGVWRGRRGRITRLTALSDRWAMAMIGGAVLQREGGSVRIPQVRMAMSGGGLVQAHGMSWDGGRIRGAVMLHHIPMGVAASLGGIRGTFTGRGYGAVHADESIHGWASIKGLRRLPAMADFPVDMELRASRDDRETAVHSLEITHGDLRITGHGRLDSARILFAEAESRRSPLSKVLILADELLHAGLRPIFDARSGTITAHIVAAGPVATPTLTGTIAVEDDAHIVVKPIRTTFRSVTGSARLEGHSIIIDDVGGESVRGSARIRGRLELPGLVLDEASFDITGRGQEFRILRGIYGIYDADIALAKRGMGISLDGEARLIEGLIDLPSIPIEPLPPTEAGMDDQWFLNVIAERGVWVRDRFLNAEVAGHVVVEKEQGIVAMQGDLEVLRGTYLYLGRKFTLQEGRVSFLGGPLIIPELDVTATTTVRGDRKEGSDITLTLRVTGRVDDPILRVAADDAGYSEEQIKTMLLFNLTPDDVLALWQGDAFAKEAAGAVEEFLAGELVRVLRAEAGLDELEVSPSLLSSEDRDVHVRLGKYLTPELFVSVASGLRSMGFDEVRIEYLLRTLARRIGLGDAIDLKLVGERTQDVYSRTTYQVQLKLKYKF